ncbi:hypothetical protein [Xanthomonas citri]|uniref:hypothetical protein n=1 Tax=Xanthomonas citri TaxID=346 RepID=UPI0011AF5078|nr:hypothetical protein [Xanthomonas citri]
MKTGKFNEQAHDYLHDLQRRWLLPADALRAVPEQHAIQERQHGRLEPREPDRETSSAEIELKWTGGRRHELLLDGDQHRDLEDRDMLPELLARFAYGDDPDVVLAEVLEQVQAPSP